MIYCIRECGFALFKSFHSAAGLVAHELAGDGEIAAGGFLGA
jgi:hypothetical protein